MFKRLFKLLAFSALFALLSIYSYAADAPGGEVSDAASLLAALGGDAAGWINGRGEVCLCDDITLTAPITINGGTITVNGAGCVIRRGTAGGAMIILNNGTLILGNPKNTDVDDTLILDGGGEALSGSTIIEQYGGVIDFYNGTSLQNNTASKNGGAVTLGGGVFNMHGGQIRGCSALSGGGIYISDGEFSMTGGQISACTAAENGGGICAEGGVLTVNGGTIGGTVITAEYAAEPAVQTDAGNSAQNGGGIALTGGIHSVNGGTIAANNAALGGGIALFREAELLLYGGGVLYNNASQGGGIYNAGKTAHLYAEIARNTADTGGGVYNIANAEYYLQQGIISSNSAAKPGGGINNEGTFVMSGGSVNYNETAGSGGGLVNTGSFSLSGGSFGYNKAAEPGSEMLCYDSGSVVFSDAVFIGGKGDIALVRRDVAGDGALITLRGELTCTTKVARLTPVVFANGAISEDYKKGRTLLAVAEGNEQGLDYYIPLFDVPDDLTGGAWHISDDGTLARNLPGIWFWAAAAAVAVFIAGGVVFVIKARK
jgi:hypothetical protein